MAQPVIQINVECDIFELRLSDRVPAFMQPRSALVNPFGGGKLLCLHSSNILYAYTVFKPKFLYDSPSTNAVVVPVPKPTIYPAERPPDQN